MRSPKDAMNPLLTPHQEQQVRAEIAAGRTIQAIKLYREFTNLGLKESKDAVDVMARHPSGTGSPTTMPLFSGETGEAQPRSHLPEEVQQLVQAGQKIQAIKLYREATGVGLKQAKDAVEALAAGAPLAPKSRLERRRQSGGGFLYAVLLAIALAGIALLVWFGIRISK